LGDSQSSFRGIDWKDEWMFSCPISTMHHVIDLD
jgi:hypothetical protein